MDYLYTLPFASSGAREIDGVDMRALVDVDTEIIENYWGVYFTTKSVN